MSRGRPTVAWECSFGAMKCSPVLRSPHTIFCCVCGQGWNGITARDSELLRRVATIERFFGKVKGLLTSPEWEPHTLDVYSLDGEVYGSKFPSSDGSQIVWLLVNALPHNASAFVNVSAAIGPHTAVPAIADCYNGALLHATNGSSGVTVPIEASAIGCVYASRTQ